MSDKLDTIMVPGLPHEAPDFYIEPTNTPKNDLYYVEHTVRFVYGGAEYSIVGVSQKWLDLVRGAIEQYLAECGPDCESAVAAVREENKEEIE